MTLAQDKLELNFFCLFSKQIELELDKTRLDSFAVLVRKGGAVPSSYTELISPNIITVGDHQYLAFVRPLPARPW